MSRCCTWPVSHVQYLYSRPLFSYSRDILHCTEVKLGASLDWQMLHAFCHTSYQSHVHPRCLHNERCRSLELVQTATQDTGPVPRCVLPDSNQLAPRHQQRVNRESVHTVNSQTTLKVVGVHSRASKYAVNIVMGVMLVHRHI